MLQKTIKKIIDNAVEENYNLKINHTVSYPPEELKIDFASNVSFILSKKPNETKSPQEIANNLKKTLEAKKYKEISAVTEKNGFLNITLDDKYLLNYLKKASNKNWGKNNFLNNKKVLVEYTDPNPFKEMHIGHLMSNSIGESISRIFAFCGGEIVKICYQGDVGLHVAKAIYVLKKENLELKKDSLKNVYAKGQELYENDENAKKEIDLLNTKIYKEIDSKENTDLVNIWKKGRSISLNEFETIYKRIGTKFDVYIFESEVGKIGEGIVLDSKVFSRDGETIIYKGEEKDKNLHTRVFINKNKIPTYETKEIGLAVKKEKLNPDLSIVITANEIIDYMKVVYSALESINKKITKYTEHITHGVLKLSTGKMSSRTGDVLLAKDFLDEVRDKIIKQSGDKLNKESADKIAVGAIRYEVLKTTRGKDIVFDVDKSISFNGDSGVYLLYTKVRLDKLIKDSGIFTRIFNTKLYNRKDIIHFLYKFEDVVFNCLEKRDSHYMVSYLTKLSAMTNLWYQEEKILNTKNEREKIALIKAISNTIKNGCYLLGIETVKEM